MNTELTNNLARAVEAFANLVDHGGNSTIESTVQVETIFAFAVAKIARGHVALQTIEPENTDAYRDDQILVRAWLVKCSRLKNRAPRERVTVLRELRAELAPILSELAFVTTVEFDMRGDGLRVVPKVFGVKAACFLVIAATLERDTSVQVARCGEHRCRRFAIAHGGVRGKKRAHCPEHHIAHSKRAQP